jgi:hypothetical protein
MLRSATGYATMHNYEGRLCRLVLLNGRRELAELILTCDEAKELADCLLDSAKRAEEPSRREKMAKTATAKPEENVL